MSIFILIIIRTVKWKKAIDDSAKFLDGGKLPCILVETKCDLLEPEVVEDTTELREFANKNGYDGYFKTSALSGRNINESMKYLIFRIIERLEAIEEAQENDDNE